MITTLNFKTDKKDHVLSLNNFQPTRYSKTRDALIDYTIIGNSVKNLYSEIFDSPIRIDYFSHLVILDKKLEKKNKPTKKAIYYLKKLQCT